MAWLYTIISDLHLGDHSGADDFWRSGSAPLLERLIAGIGANPGHHLVLLGDIFEQWQFTLDEILRYNAAVLDSMLALAAEGRLTYVIGNHDYEPFNLYLPAGRLFGTIPLVEQFEIPEAGVLALHGHRQDPHPERMIPVPGHEGAYQVSRRFVYYLKYLERRYPDIDERLSAVGEAAQRGWRSAGYIWQVMGRLGRNEARNYFSLIERQLLGWRPPSQRPLSQRPLSQRPLSQRIPSSGLPDPPDDPWEAAALTLLSSPTRRYRTVIMGHTHVPRWVCWGDRTYLNTGSWCYASRYPCSYVQIDLRVPSASLWRTWHDRRHQIRTARWDERMERRTR